MRLKAKRAWHTSRGCRVQNSGLQSMYHAEFGLHKLALHIMRRPQRAPKLGQKQFIAEPSVVVPYPSNKECKRSN